MLPPRPVRRVTGPLLVAALVAAVVLLPALVVVAVVGILFTPIVARTVRSARQAWREDESPYQTVARLRFPKRDYEEGPGGSSWWVRFNRRSVTVLPSPLPCGQNRSTYPRGFEGRQARPKVTLAPSHNHLRNTWGTLHGTQ